MTDKTLQERLRDRHLQFHADGGPSLEWAAADALDCQAETLRFVERWANHHGQKDCVKPEHALATIQHYPPILAITRGYADGKVPETRNPWAELAAMKEKVESLERAYASVMQAVDECGSYRP